MFILHTYWLLPVRESHGIIHVDILPLSDVLNHIQNVLKYYNYGKKIGESCRNNFLRYHTITFHKRWSKIKVSIRVQLGRIILMLVYRIIFLHNHRNVFSLD